MSQVAVSESIASQRMRWWKVRKMSQAEKDKKRPRKRGKILNVTLIKNNSHNK